MKDVRNDASKHYLEIIENMRMYIDVAFRISVLFIIFHATYLSTFNSQTQLITELLPPVLINRLGHLHPLTHYFSLFLPLRLD